MSKNGSITVKNILNTEFFIKNSLLNSKYGLVKLDKFIIKIDLPSKLKTNVDSSVLTINAVSASVPSIEEEISMFELNSLKFYYYQSRKDDTFSISFLEDASFTIRKLFYNWISLGFNIETQSRNYFDDVKSNRVEVIPILPENQILNADIFREVIPFSISSMDYDIQKNTELYLVKIDFKYVYHEIGKSNLR